MLIALIYDNLRRQQCIRASFKAECSDEQTDDIVIFGRSIYSLDRKGNLYKISTSEKFLGFKTLVATACKELEEEGEMGAYRNRLVIPSTFFIGKLYLVARKKEMLKVYELSRRDKFWNSWDCVEVQRFGDKDDKVLFVTRDYSFFASANEFPGCQLSNCIVFSHDAFPPYFNTDMELPKDGGGIYIYQLGGDSHVFMPISCYLGFPLHLWSPPPWVSQSQSHCREPDAEKKEDKPSVKSCQDEDIWHDCASFFEPESEKHLTNISSTSADADKFTGTPTVNDPKQVAEEGKTSCNQINRSDSSTVNFKGFEIRASLAPTLQKIWSKHGNIIENCLISNGDTIARALESLATVVLILEGNSARSLTDCQVEYLSSTLFDLRSLSFQVDWLVHFVEKAVGLHKRKPLLDSFNNLRQLNEEATECILNLLDEVAKLEEMQKQLKEDIANLSKRISFSGEFGLAFRIGVDMKTVIVG